MPSESVAPRSIANFRSSAAASTRPVLIAFAGTSFAYIFVSAAFVTMKRRNGSSPSQNTLRVSTAASERSLT